MKIRKQRSKGLKLIGYHLQGEHVSNFTFKIEDVMFNGDETLVSLYNNIHRERFFSIKPKNNGVYFTFQEFEIKCLDKGNYVFFKDLSTAEFRAILDFEYNNFLKRK